MAKCIVIPGGAGFIGSRLALRFKERSPDARVIALDNLRRRGSEMNLPLLKAAGVEFFHGDVRNPADLAGLGAVDLIVECSAEPSVLAGYGGDPSYVIDSNLTGALNCLHLARRTGAGFIFLSTSRVYPIDALNELPYTVLEDRFELADALSIGCGPRGVSEEFPLAGARSIYGATKLCAELMVAEFRAAYAIPALVNRFGVVTGPGQFGKLDQGVFALWMGMHAFDRPLTYVGWGGDGKQVRDLLHVDDLVDLIEYQSDHLHTLDGSTFNVGGGRDCSLSLRETTALCREITGRRPPIGASLETRPGDVRIYITDTARVEAATGWRRRRGAGETLEDIFRWIRKNEDAVRHHWIG